MSALMLALTLARRKDTNISHIAVMGIVCRFISKSIIERQRGRLSGLRPGELGTRGTGDKWNREQEMSRTGDKWNGGTGDKQNIEQSSS